MRDLMIDFHKISRALSSSKKALLSSGQSDAIMRINAAEKEFDRALSYSLSRNK